MEGWRDGGMEGWRDGGMEGWFSIPCLYDTMLIWR
ncbi:hypothetical protein MNBD_NITROSPIRAE02-898, partial [hydrothermal vent metagenome]